MEETVNLEKVQEEAPFAANEVKSLMVIDELCKIHLAMQAKWMKVLGIIGYVALGMYVLGVLLVVVGGILAGKPSLVFFALLLSLFLLLIYYPVRHMYASAKYMKEALAEEDQNKLEKAFSESADFWNFIGTLYCIILVIYVILFLLSILLR